MKFLNFCLIILILLNSRISTITSCEQYIKQDDRAILKNLKENFSKFKTEELEACTEILMKSNHFTSLEFLLNEMTKTNLKVKEMLDEKIHNYKIYLNELLQRFRFKESDYKKVSPYFRWAQSREYILIDIKFTEDSRLPVCTEVEHVSFDIPHSNNIHFQAYCNQYDTPIKFELPILLSKDINKLRSTWGLVKDGSYQATLKKSAIEKWDSLFKSGVEIPSNMEIWYEMEVLIAKEERMNNLGYRESSDDSDNEEDGHPDDKENKIESKSKRHKGKDNKFVSFMDNSLFNIFK